MRAEGIRLPRADSPKCAMPPFRAPSRGVPSPRTDPTTSCSPSDGAFFSSKRPPANEPVRHPRETTIGSRPALSNSEGGSVTISQVCAAEWPK